MHFDIRSSNYNIAHNVSHVTSENFLIHSHPFYEIYYFLSGDVHFLYGSIEYTLKPHTMIIVVPDMFHGIHVLSKEPYERYTMHFTDDLISSPRRNLLLGSLPTEGTVRTGKSVIPHIISDATSMHLLPLLEEYENISKQPRQNQDMLVSSLTETFLSLLLMHYGREVENNEGGTLLLHPRSREMDAILAYVHENLTEKITLEELSEHFYLSKGKLNSMFKEKTGTTAMDYILKRRLNYAQQLLINGYPATQAGIAAGFGDYTSFYRAYVKQMGHSPKDDKNSERNLGAPIPTHDSLLMFDNAYATVTDPEDAEDIWINHRPTNASAMDPVILHD